MKLEAKIILLPFYPFHRFHRCEFLCSSLLVAKQQVALHSRADLHDQNELSLQ